LVRPVLHSCTPQGRRIDGPRLRYPPLPPPPPLLGYPSSLVSPSYAGLFSAANFFLPSLHRPVERTGSKLPCNLLPPLDSSAKTTTCKGLDASDTPMRVLLFPWRSCDAAPFFTTPCRLPFNDFLRSGLQTSVALSGVIHRGIVTRRWLEAPNEQLLSAAVAFALFSPFPLFPPPPT